MASWVKAEYAAANVRVWVTTATVRPRNAHPASGRGFTTRPTAVKRKIEVKFQA